MTVGYKFGSSQQARSFFQNPELRQAMQDAGVDASSLRIEFYEEA